jgi:hypothetical protein
MVYSTMSMVNSTKSMVHSCRLGILILRLILGSWDTVEDSLHPLLSVLRPWHRDCSVASVDKLSSSSFKATYGVLEAASWVLEKKDEYYLNLVAQNQALLSVSWSNILFITTKYTWCIPYFINNCLHLIYSNWHNKRASWCQHMGCHL